MRRGDRTEQTATLIQRLDVLERLCQSPAYIRDLVSETGQSRSTINRAINELEDIGLVERGDDGIEPTTAGRLARDRLDTFLTAFDDILAAAAVLDSMPSETSIDPQIVDGCEAILAADPAPYRALERIHDDLVDATSYRALVPKLEDPRQIRLLYEHVVTAGNPAELVVPPEVFATLREEFPRRMAAMADEGGFSVFVGSVPPFGLGLLDGESSSEKPPTTTAHVVRHNDRGGVYGVLVNDSETAVQWAENQYRAYREEATDRTDELIADPDGGVEAVDGDGELVTRGQSLPISLEREGFVGIDVSYFRDEPVADPSTAWRTGLSLAEVHTGYAIPRTYTFGDDASRDDASRDDASRDDASRDDGSRDDHRELATTLTADLVAGSDCIVVGSPGSGKSTICKRVACEWYDADRGPVLYRESDRGRAFASVDELVTTVTAADGHALIVVEDAVRPGSSAIFEAISRLTDREDVSVLLDAREHEWNDQSNWAVDVTDLDIVYVPPVTERDCTRLVEHFERTAGRPVDVSAESLWAAVRDEAATGEDDSSNVMLRLIHRLATYAEPLADGPTALEEAVASAYEELADDEGTLSACILANALNAAGLGIDRGLLYAVADGGDADGDFDAAGRDFDATLDRLEGHVLFPLEDGSYRTVHEEWSTTFLTHLVETEGDETAAQRFGTVVSALLALADDPERCKRIESRLDDQWALAALIEDPGRWAEETVEALYAMGRERPKLAPLFGDGTDDSIDLPAACSDRSGDERPVWLGQMFLAGGYYDRAERAFERLPLKDTAYAGERLIGLARVAIGRGEYDDAITRCRACLSLGVPENGQLPLVDPENGSLLRARARVHLGEAMAERGKFDDATAHYEAALDEFQAGTHRGWEARALHRLGNVTMERGEFDRAREYYESSLERRRELGDRRGEAETLNSIGNVAWKQGAYDRAAELFERALERRREVGDRPGVAASLNNLGAIAGQRGDYDRAAELYGRSLERRRELGDRSGVARCLHNLGHLEAHRGNFDDASKFYEQSLDLKRELGDRHRATSTLNNLGTIEGRRGNYDRAFELHERCLEQRRELGDRHGIISSLQNLATVERRRGNFARAAELSEQTLEQSREIGDRPRVASGLIDLGMVAERYGEYDRTREHCERGLEIATEIGDFEQIARGHRCLGVTAVREGAYERAHDHIEDALDAVEEGGQTEMQIRLLSGQLALARGDLDRARSITSAVRETVDEMGAIHWVAQSDHLLGRIAAEAGEDDRAREHVLDALDVFEKIGAAHDTLLTLRWLVETTSENDDRVEQWRRRARELSSNLPEGIVEQ